MVDLRFTIVKTTTYIPVLNVIASCQGFFLLLLWFMLAKRTFNTDDDTNNSFHSFLSPTSLVVYNSDQIPTLETHTNKMV